MHSHSGTQLQHVQPGCCHKQPHAKMDSGHPLEQVRQHRNWEAGRDGKRQGVSGTGMRWG